MKPKLSIIVPVYRAEASLSRCVESVLNQAYPNIEVILVDDGSPDGSGALCDAWAGRDERISVIHQQNQGVSAARNAGMARAEGEYIAFVDCDDVVQPQIYEKLMMGATRDCMPICGICIVDENLNPGCEKPVHTQAGELSVAQFYDLCENFSMNSPVNKVFSAEIIRKYNLAFQNDLSLGEDLLFVLDYLQYMKSMYIINEPLYLYVQANGESLSQKYRNDFYKSQVCILEGIRKTFDRLHIDFEPYRRRYYTLALDLLLQSMHHQLRRECPMSKKEIIAFNNQIMRSPLYRQALKHSDRKMLRPDWRLVYSGWHYGLVMGYSNMLDRVKRIISKKQR